jgi:transaldolase
MNPLARLAELGQSIWQDDIRRDQLDDGTIASRIADWAVTGLTSNPSIFDKAIAGSDLYDAAIAELVAGGMTDPEELFFELAIQDLQRAADLFAPVFEQTGGLDGCVSLEVSPTLADDAAATTAQAAELFARADRPNLMIKIPGTPAGLPAITSTIAAGIPVNVTLLFSVEQYLAQVEAWIVGLEQRHAAGGSLINLPSVASIFVSRWDVAANAELPTEHHNKLGVAVCAAAYAAYRELLASDRFAVLAAAGATPQRLLFASTSTKDPALPDTMYVEQLAADNTVNTMPVNTLIAFADHGTVPAGLPADGGPAALDVAVVANAGVDVNGLGQLLQEQGKQSFVASWDSLMASLRNQAA